MSQSTLSTVPTVLYAEHGAVAVVALNRPEALNSFTRQMHTELWAALDKAEANAAIRALVITGAGRAFCAGADLAEFDFAPGPSVEDLMRRADPGPVIEQLFNPTARRLAKPAHAHHRCGERCGGGRWRIVGDELRYGHCRT